MLPILAVPLETSLVAYMELSSCSRSSSAGTSSKKSPTATTETRQNPTTKHDPQKSDGQ